MLSISSRSSGADAAAYYEHLASDRERGLEDYYSAGDHGYFLGSGADAMGLNNSVSRQDFEQLANGYTVLGNVQNAGSEYRKAAWDLTFSSPKSVSILWGLASPVIRKIIQAAHDCAVKSSLDFMERHASFTRRGSGLKLSDRERLEKIWLVAAVYRHGTSREQDPQIHSHVVVFNVAVRKDNSVGAVMSHHFYEWKMACGAVYRAQLANELQRLGYNVERDGKSFRVTGVPKQLEYEFSRRREQIVKALKDHGARGAKASEVATLDTRRVKREISRETLLEDWQQRAHERAPHWSAEQTLNRTNEQEHAVLNVSSLQMQMTIQSSTLSEAQLYTQVAIERQIYDDISNIERSVAAVKADRETVTLEDHHHETRFTTREMQQLEAAMVERAEKMYKTKTHAVDPDNIKAAIESRATLSDEQRKAIEHITKGNDLACVTGDAGTGKSFMLSAAREAWESQGYRVRGASLSGKAAQQLQQSSGIKSTTLKSLEMSSKGYLDEQGQFHTPTDKLRAKDVLVIDEASMSGSRQTAALLEDAERAHTKVILIGDSRQLQSIYAGAAFRAIEERVGSASMVDIRRQSDLHDRQAVRDLRDGKAYQALENFAQRGRVHKSNTSREAKEEIGKAVVQDLLEGKLSLALTGTRVETLDVNHAAREAAREKGLVASHDVTVITSNGERHFAEGDRILFCRNNKTLDVKNGDLGTMKTIHEHGSCVRMTVILDRGGERNVDTLKYDQLTYGYCVTTHKAQGSTVDRCHILVTDNGMSSREWSYVAASRAREETHIHGDKHTLQELAPAWSKARQKDVTLDYQLAEEQEYEKPRDKEREALVQGPIFELTRNN